MWLNFAYHQYFKEVSRLNALQSVLLFDPSTPMKHLLVTNVSYKSDNSFFAVPEMSLTYTLVNGRFVGSEATFFRSND